MLVNVEDNIDSGEVGLDNDDGWEEI